MKTHQIPLGITNADKFRRIYEIVRFRMISLFRK